jgi:hypothetical protein
MMIWAKDLDWEKLDKVFPTTSQWAISDTAWNPPEWLVKLEGKNV